MPNPTYNMTLEKSGIQLIPGMKLEQIKDHIDELDIHMKNSNEINKGIFKEQEWVAGYATMYSREAINKVGLFDEKFKNGCEDLDLCKRLKKYGYKIGQALDSFILHFGGVSRGAYQTENKEHYDKEDKYNHLYLNEKYCKENVVLYSGPSWEKWDFRNVDQGGIGGSETWQVWLARELVKLGYRVKSFCDCPESGIMDGDIEYLHWSQYNSYIDQNFIDYFISSRTTDPFKYPLRAGKTFVQIHDVFLLSERSQILLDKINKFCVLSEWHRKFAGEYHGIPDDKFALMANGLDFSRYDGQKVEREPFRLFYSSSADRGLDTLLYLFPFMKKEIPQLELHVYYGFNTWLASAKDNPDELKKIEDIKKAMNQPGVFLHGRIGQKELAIEQLKSSLWAFPTSFEEVFCISAIEAQAAGCPIIASNYAGLQTTVGDSGILIGNGNKSESYTKEYREKFVAECLSILTDKEKWQYWSERGFKNSEKYSWANVARMWQVLFKK
jgi:glycosyltransferase involved in cell wall biosynthesis